MMFYDGPCGLVQHDNHDQEIQSKLVVSMDWFKGTFTGKPHIKNGKIYGFLEKNP